MGGKPCFEESRIMLKPMIYVPIKRRNKKAGSAMVLQSISLTCWQNLIGGIFGNQERSVGLNRHSNRIVSS